MQLITNRQLRFSISHAYEQAQSATKSQDTQRLDYRASTSSTQKEGEVF